MLACATPSWKYRMTTPRWRLILNGKSAGNEELREAVGHWRGQGVQLQRYRDGGLADAKTFVDKLSANGGTIWRRPILDIPMPVMAE